MQNWSLLCPHCSLCIPLVHVSPCERAPWLQICTHTAVAADKESQPRTSSRHWGLNTSIVVCSTVGAPPAVGRRIAFTMLRAVKRQLKCPPKHAMHLQATYPPLQCSCIDNSRNRNTLDLLYSYKLYIMVRHMMNLQKGRIKCLG